LPAGKTAEPGSWNFQRDGAKNIPDHKRHKVDGRSDVLRLQNREAGRAAKSRRLFKNP
jgi:hypothetical protein